MASQSKSTVPVGVAIAVILTLVLFLVGLGAFAVWVFTQPQTPSVVASANIQDDTYVVSSEQDINDNNLGNDTTPPAPSVQDTRDDNEFSIIPVRNAFVQIIVNFEDLTEQMQILTGNDDIGRDSDWQDNMRSLISDGHSLVSSSRNYFTVGLSQDERLLRDDFFDFLTAYSRMLDDFDNLRRASSRGVTIERTEYMRELRHVILDIELHMFQFAEDWIL